jgi:hypothetical protein
MTEPGHQEPAEDHKDEAADEAVDDRDGHADRADELDATRIHQFAALKKAAIRARSYALIGAVLAAVSAVKLVLLVIERVRAAGWGLMTIAYALLVCVTGMLAVHFVRRAVALHREASAPAPLPPVPPGGPDISTLSDGSQRWKNLDEIR